MKKMNLNFLGLRAKMVLPLFLLIGLFMFSASTVSAQYVSSDEAVVLIKEHVNQVPLKNTIVSRVLRKNEDLNAAQALEYRNLSRVKIGKAISREIREKGASVADAIERVYTKVASRIPDGASPVILETLNGVRDEYVELLTN